MTRPGQQQARLVTFALDERRYGVDVLTVQEVLRGQVRTPIPGAPAELAGLINLRGQVMTTFDLRERLGLPPAPSDSEPMLIVVHVTAGPVALLVDRVGSVVDVGPASLEPVPDTLSGPTREFIVGAYKLPHQLLLALDVERAVAA